MDRRHARWDDTEIWLLHMAYGRVPTKRLAAVLGRTAGAVRQKARLAGVDSYRGWDGDMMDELRRNFGVMAQKDIADMLGVDTRSVKSMAVRLGLLERGERWPRAGRGTA